MSNTETTAVEAKANISPEIIAIADAIRPLATLDVAGNGTLTAEAYEASLVAVGLDKETALKLSKHNVNYSLATGFVLGELSIPVMTANKELNRTSLVAPTIGKDQVTATFDRSRVVPDKNAEGGKRLAYGSLSIDLSFHGGKNGANLTAIKKLYSGAATSAFCD